MKKYAKILISALCMGVFAYAFAAPKNNQEALASPFDNSGVAYFDQDNFAAQINKPGYMIVDFWMDGCKVCKEIEEPVKNLADQNYYIKINDKKVFLTVGDFKITTKQELEKWGGKYGFSTLPALVILKDGVQVKTINADIASKMLKEVNEFLSTAMQK